MSEELWKNAYNAFRKVLSVDLEVMKAEVELSEALLKLFPEDEAVKKETEVAKKDLTDIKQETEKLMIMSWEDFKKMVTDKVSKT